VNCNVSGNSAGDSGGGVYCGPQASPIISNCCIGANTAYCGGGVYCYDSNPLITNCAITGNTATGYQGWAGGGGVLAASSNLTMANCTVAGNAANSSYGGGVYCYDFSSATLSNCILWGNSDMGGMDESAQIQVWTSDVTVNYCCVQGWTGGLGGTGNIGDDPRFVDADGADDVPGTEDDNLCFLPCSPCIDAADNDAVPPDVADLDGDGDTTEPTPVDLDGNPRFVDDPYTPDMGNGTPPIVDMGAYEFQADCPGDLNGDRVVDQADLGILLAAWGSSAEGDLNCDGVTGHADLGVLLAHWGEGCP